MPVLATDKPTWIRSATYFLPMALLQFTIVVMSLFFLFGTLFFCRIPFLTRGTGVNASDVAIRCLDWHQAEPLYLLEGYQPSAEIAVRWPNVVISKVETTSLPNRGYRHAVHSVSGTVTEVETRTPHTNLTRAQIEEARAGLEKLYPPAERLAWAQALSWGEGLMLRWFAGSFKEGRSSANPPIVNPHQGTDGEKIWFAWQRLRGGEATAGDLARLGALARQAYPAAADYEAAMAWARAFHERRERYYREWLTMKRSQRSDMAFYGETCMPPLVDATLWWILYQHIGLDEASRVSARQRWLRFFPGHVAQTLEWGRSVEAKRRAAGEALPPSNDNVALLCAIERLTGWDDDGVRTRELALQALDPFPGSSFGSVDTFVQLAISIAYPSDDVFLLLASGDSLGLGVIESWNMDRSTTWTYIAWLLGWFFMLAIFLFLVRCMVLDTLGGTLLFMREHDRFRGYFNSQTRTNLKALALGFLLVPILKWGWEWYKLKPPTELLMASPFRLFVGVYMGVLFGGLIILVINRLVAVALIRCGFNIERTWADEIIGTTLGVLLLWYFGNGWASLLAFSAAGVLPDAFKRWWKRRHPPPTRLAPVTLTPAAALAARQWLKREPQKPFLRVFDDGAAWCLDLEARYDPARDVLVLPRGVPVVAFQHQADGLRGAVVDHTGTPPRFVIHPPGTGPQPADEDESVTDPEPLILELYPAARWTGLLVGLTFMGFTAFALACENRVSPPQRVTGAPVTLHLDYPANAGWLATGITLDPDMIVHVQATGVVEAAPATDARATHHAVPPAGREPQVHYPAPKEPGLALLGKVSQTPFLLGDRQAFQVNDKGAKLLLGMNDDDPSDNRGHWHVTITVYKEKP